MNFLIEGKSTMKNAMVRNKKKRTIQYGYRKYETHERVFSQTLMHGNSKNEIRQRNKMKKRSEEGVK